MVKSPEEYLSTMSFDAGSPSSQSQTLDAGERAFIEKYLGIDALTSIPAQYPEPLPLPSPAVAQPPLPFKEPEIIIAPEITEQNQEEIIVAEKAQANIPSPKIEDTIKIATDAEVKPQLPYSLIATQKLAVRERQKAKIEIVSDVTPINSPDTPQPLEIKSPQEIQHTTDQAATLSSAKKPVLQKKLREDTPEIDTEIAQAQVTGVSDYPQNLTLSKVNAETENALSAESALREKMRNAEEIQVVSFYVAGQLFLLPVEGIQEVVRHMDLIKVPQAPPFIAGAINLRGMVMPLVRLSALLTNEPEIPYDKKNFVIITGTDKLRMGLIIDKVSSMHMVPQKKIIWNAESKLGDAAEFLSAIIDLDDRVCGMVAPETIAQKILPEL